MSNHCLITFTILPPTPDSEFLSSRRSVFHDFFWCVTLLKQETHRLPPRESYVSLTNWVTREDTQSGSTILEIPWSLFSLVEQVP